ncbi:MAG TPA: PKD domain-containing protein [Methanospirillum sp.]|nr:PKD domain-containing protein [Methanospirillum sp.]
MDPDPLLGPHKVGDLYHLRIQVTDQIHNPVYPAEVTLWYSSNDSSRSYEEKKSVGSDGIALIEGVWAPEMEGYISISAVVAQENGNSGSNVLNMRIQGINHTNPWAYITALGSDLTVLFSESGISEMPIKGYIWSFGDGSEPSYVSSPVHTYHMNGSYQVRLSVEDIMGNSDATSMEITVPRP